MLKFLVVLYKLLALSEAEFAHFLREMHGPLAENAPACKTSMEAAWRSPKGTAATEDLIMFADLERSTRSVVEERRLRRCL